MVVRMILSLKKFNMPTSWLINMALAVSKVFRFDPNSVLHTLAQSRIFISGVLDSVCW